MTKKAPSSSGRIVAMVALVAVVAVVAQKYKFPLFIYIHDCIQTKLEKTQNSLILNSRQGRIM